ncbi:protein phosphatase 2C family protein [Patescibacteria group bacterium]|nr:protein phosphatase 2C family protein [Patescibacteria group bacterium]
MVSEKANILFGVASLRGGREFQEDSFFMLPLVGGFVCGLFDGHGGAGGSQAAARIMPEYFSAGVNPRDAIEDSFDDVHQKINETAGGTTAMVVHCSGSQLTCGWVGDSRCIIIGSSTVITLTRDHRPSNADERSRIKDSGGVIVLKGSTEYIAHPTNGSALMMTRALGDHSFESAGIIPSPEIVNYQIRPDDRFCCLICDGVWESVTNDELLQLAKGRRSPQRLAAAIAKRAIRNGSKDNVTAVVCKLAN